MSVLKKGTVLEQTYEIMEEIGAGGGGIVYKARHLRLQTDVVVKKIKDEVKGKMKTRQEADILKNLKHPYLPRVYDFIETEDGVYTVMDFIQGEDLSNAVKRHGKYSQKQVKKWAKQLGEALNYLHSQKPAIIHSDIKPANIMLTQEGDICLIDFNIALAMGGTMESTVGISAGYSPPEQYRDCALYEKITHNYTQQRFVQSTQLLESSEEEEQTQLLELSEGEEQTQLLEFSEEEEQTELMSAADEDKTEILPVTGNLEDSKSHISKYVRYIGKGIDERSDIYSLGITLCYLLTGIEPSADFDQKILPAEMKVSLSEGFAVILNKMTEVNSADRYQNGGEFLKAITNCHKLDHRYIAMHRKEAGIRIASLTCLFTGVLVGFAGMYRMQVEKNAAYYGFLQQAQEAMSRYEYEDANVFLENAKEISQIRVDAYQEEIYLMYLRGDYQECVSLGEEYINTIPFQAESGEEKEQLGNLYYIIGNAYFEMQDYASAAKLLANALEYYEENGLFYRDYAITLAKLGQRDNAQKQLEEGIAHGLGQDSIYMAQGEIACVKGQYEDAIKYLKETISLTEDEQMRKRAVLLCTDVYKTMGDIMVDEEIALLEQYADQENPVMTVYLAEAYARKAKTDEMQTAVCYGKALDLFVSVYEQGYVTYQVQENMAILYENMEQFDEAERLLLEMAENYSERYEVYKRLAFLEADRQQKKENSDRDYRKMASYYGQAMERYSEEEQDMEMQMLEGMMQELKDGGWL